MFSSTLKFCLWHSAKIYSRVMVFWLYLHLFFPVISVKSGESRNVTDMFHYVLWARSVIFQSVSSVAQSYDSLWPHGMQHARLPCPSQLPEFAQTHIHRVGDVLTNWFPLFWFLKILIKTYSFSLKPDNTIQFFSFLILLSPHTPSFYLQVSWIWLQIILNYDASWKPN